MMCHLITNGKAFLGRKKNGVLHTCPYYSKHVNETKISMVYTLTPNYEASVYY